MQVVERQQDKSTGLDAQQVADLLRLVRLFLAEVDAAGAGGARLTRDSPVVQLARRLIDADAGERESTRTALMALRDLVWRVESVRYVLADQLDDRRAEALLDVLDTTDIRGFLNQEP